MLMLAYSGRDPLGSVLVDGSGCPPLACLSSRVGTVARVTVCGSVEVLDF